MKKFLKNISKTILITTILIMSILSMGCSDSNTTPLLECASPLIYNDGGCCMDANADGKCDPKKESTKTTEDKTEDETVTLDKGTDAISKAKAEETINLFVERWNYKDYNIMYTTFTKELKSKKTPLEFKTIMELDSLYKKITKIEYTGTTLQDGETEGEITIIAYTNIQEFKIPGPKVIYEDSNWRIESFSDIFDLEAIEAACGAYKNDARYPTEECTKDFAIKMQESEFCENTECFYMECMQGTKQTMTLDVKSKACDECVHGYDSSTACLLELAIEEESVVPCNSISNRKYSDKFCSCYGGFAKATNNEGICNLAGEYKSDCLKGFEGKFC